MPARASNPLAPNPEIPKPDRIPLASAAWQR